MTPPEDSPTGTTLGHLAQDISFVTRILRTKILARNEPLFADHDVVAGEVAVLSLIEINPAIAQKDLAKMVILRKSALTKLVNQLERSGLIERRKESADKRLNALYLTRRGHERLAGMRPDIDRLQAELLAPLSPGERAMLFELLWRMIGDPAATNLD